MVKDVLTVLLKNVTLNVNFHSDSTEYNVLFFACVLYNKETTRL